MFLGLPLQPREASRRADAAARSRRADRVFLDRPARLHVGHAARADRPLRQPLAPREEGSGRGAVGAEAADRLLARAQHPRALPGGRHATGILEWNKAFERIGFKDAIRVEIQPDDAEWDVARRPPRLGALDDDRAPELRRDRPVDRRSAHRRDPRRRHRVRRERAAQHPLRSRRAHRRRTAAAAPVASNRMACDYADGAAQEAGFALDLLEARDAIAPDSPETEQFIQAYVKDVVMHEVGHTLGLTHNFRASTIYSNEELADPEFTRTHGIAGSVMEYNPFNIALAGKPQGAYNMQTLGPYDYWAIEYAYREIPAEREAEELARIASRSNERELAFMMDDTIFASGLDPDVNTFDLGSDPLVYAKNRLALVRELWTRTERMPLKARRAIRDPAAQSVARPLRGEHQHPARGEVRRRRHDPARPRRQRPHAAQSGRRGEAARRADDARDRSLFGGQLPLPAGPPSAREHQLFRHREQQGARRGRAHARRRDRPAGPRAAARRAQPADEPTPSRSGCSTTKSKTASPKEALRLSELYETLHAAIWSELKTGRDITLFRAQSAARARDASRDRAVASVGDDAHRCARAAARGREAASHRARGSAGPARVFAGSARASCRSARDDRRGAEGADRPAGRLTTRCGAAGDTAVRPRRRPNGERWPDDESTRAGRVCADPARQSRAREPVRAARRESAPDRGGARRRDRAPRRRIHGFRRADAGARSRPRCCAASTRSPKSRSPSTTSSSA